MQTVLINVEGMSCSHCEKTIKQAVGALSGVKTVGVSLKNKNVTVVHDPAKATLEQIKYEIKDQGYEVK